MILGKGSRVRVTFQLNLLPIKLYGILCPYICLYINIYVFSIKKEYIVNQYFRFLNQRYLIN